MKNFETRLTEALNIASVKGDKSVKAAAELLISESSFKVGEKVIALDDPTYSFEGAVGTIKSFSTENPGYALVEYASGAQVYLQTSLLYPADRVGGGMTA